MLSWFVKARKGVALFLFETPACERRARPMKPAGATKGLPAIAPEL
jgi:hypothetical protein